MTILHDPARLLRAALRGNALFSGLSGILFLAAAQPIASFLGMEMPWVIRALGAGLLIYAIWLLECARRSVLDRREAWAAIALDSAWVVGSALLLIADPLSLTLSGKWAVGIVADLVATFALLQFYGLYQQYQRVTH